MPTDLPKRQDFRLDYLLLAIFMFGLSLAVIEVLDPAPMDVDAAQFIP